MGESEMKFDYGELDSLNDAFIRNADGPPVRFADERKPLEFKNVSGEVHFNNLESVLVREIIRHPVVLGCVAWLTNARALEALATRNWVSIIVNKEDFLRPDRGNYSQQRIRGLYSKITGGDRLKADALYSFNGDTSMDAIRCAGVRADRKQVPPRMHHKFLVFCDEGRCRHTYDSQSNVIRDRVILAGAPPDDDIEYNSQGRLQTWWEYVLQPKSVWTGSFNVSENGTRSLENAVIIRDGDVANAYLAEWRTILGISEPLNWESEYVDPEWRLGT